MTIDKVHDVQKAFRKLVEAHSFPGRIVDMASELSGIDTDLPMPPHMVLPALILLDAETRFAIADSDRGEKSRLISQLTYAGSSDVEIADFIFVDDVESFRAEALDRACEGTLENPHLGATVILDLETFRSDDPQNSGTFLPDTADSGEWILQGPGIRNERRIWIPGGRDWMERRNARNIEYPLGLDLLLVSSDGRMAALPRTTRIRPAGEER